MADITRPDWVPEWVWSEYLNWAKGAGEKDTKRAMALGILCNRDCAILWGAIERRATVARERLLNRMRPWYTPESVCDIAVHLAGDLFGEIWRAFEGPAKHELVPAGDRKRTGNRIARLARQLREEIKNTGEGDGLSLYLAPQIEDHLRDKATELAEIVAGDDRRIVIQQGKEVDEAAIDHIENVIYAGFLLAITGEVNFEAITPESPVLVALESGAKAWAESKPILYRPDDPNAGQLYFVKRLTGYFRKYYDQPFREHTAALARQLFGTDIDAATVAKLAP